MQIFIRNNTLRGVSVGFLTLFGASSGWAGDNGFIGEAGGTGPFPAVAQVVNAMPLNTLYRPKVMANDRLPLVLWGNGGCHNDGLAYSAFLQEIASHGFVVISAGTVKKASPEQAPAAPVGLKADATTSQQLLAGIDWALKENKDSSSELYQNIDEQHIAVMGHSCGGLQALQLATDPRVTTAVIFNSGVIYPAMDVQSEALKLPKSILTQLHGAVAYVNGGPSDIAYANGLDDFQRIDHVPVFFAENDVGHGGTYHSQNGGSYAQVATHWFNWQLKGEAQSGKWFVGSDCLMCNDAEWKVQQKNIQ